LRLFNLAPNKRRKYDEMLYLYIFIHNVHVPDNEKVFNYGSTLPEDYYLVTQYKRPCIQLTVTQFPSAQK
jgi:hypothetical protein